MILYYNKMKQRAFFIGFAMTISISFGLVGYYSILVVPFVSLNESVLVSYMLLMSQYLSVILGCMLSCCITEYHGRRISLVIASGLLVLSGSIFSLRSLGLEEGLLFVGFILFGLG